jgi:hypothetical protein
MRVIDMECSIPRRRPGEDPTPGDRAATGAQQASSRRRELRSRRIFVDGHEVVLDDLNPRRVNPAPVRTRAQEGDRPSARTQ